MNSDNVIYVNGDNAIYFGSFEVEYIPKEIKKFISNKNIKTNIYRIRASNSIILLDLLILC